MQGLFSLGFKVDWFSLIVFLIYVSSERIITTDECFLFQASHIGWLNPYMRKYTILIQILNDPLLVWWGEYSIEN